jgi:hypothetical protein
MFWRSGQRKIYTSYKEYIKDKVKQIAWWSMIGVVVVYFLYILEAMVSYMSSGLI